MKKLNVSNITVSALQPIKQGTLTHLQEAHQETTAALATHLANANNTTSTFGIIYGCRLNISGGNYTITQGAIFYNGEIFLVDAVGSTANPSGGDSRICKLVTTYVTAANADPVTMTDSSSVNVHEVRKIVIENGTSATVGYVGEYADLIRLHSNSMGASTATWNGNYSFTFDNNRYLHFTSVATGLSTIDVDLTNAMIGCVQRFSASFINADSLGVSGSFAPDLEWILPTGTEFFTSSLPIAIAFTGNTDVVGEITYLGLNRVAVKLYGV